MSYRKIIGKLSFMYRNLITLLLIQFIMNQMGLSNILDRMKHYQNLYGNKFEPRPMLVEMAEKNEKFELFT